MKTEKEIYKEIENIWNKIVSIKDRERIIKGIEDGKISLDKVKLSKDEVIFRTWEDFNLNATIPPDIAMKLKIYYGIPYEVRDENHGLCVIFYNEKTPSWASSLIFDEYGNIDYKLKCVIFFSQISIEEGFKKRSINRRNIY